MGFAPDLFSLRPDRALLRKGAIMPLSSVIVTRLTHETYYEQRFALMKRSRALGAADDRRLQEVSKLRERLRVLEGDLAASNERERKQIEAEGDVLQRDYLRFVEEEQAYLAEQFEMLERGA
jgi:hypothetical protein